MPPCGAAARPPEATLLKAAAAARSATSARRAKEAVVGEGSGLGGGAEPASMTGESGSPTAPRPEVEARSLALSDTPLHNNPSSCEAVEWEKRW